MMKQKSYLQLVIFTSSDEKHAREESYRNGADSNAVKHLDADEFARVVMEICRHRVFMNEPPHDAP